jgi:hypothetical protein
MDAFLSKGMGKNCDHETILQLEEYAVKDGPARPFPS